MPRRILFRNKLKNKLTTQSQPVLYLLAKPRRKMFDASCQFTLPLQRFVNMFPLEFEPAKKKIKFTFHF